MVATAAAIWMAWESYWCPPLKCKPRQPVHLGWAFPVASLSRRDRGTEAFTILSVWHSPREISSFPELLSRHSTPALCLEPHPQAQDPHGQAPQAVPRRWAEGPAPPGTPLHRDPSRSLTVGESPGVGKRKDKSKQWWTMLVYFRSSSTWYMG